MQTLVAGNVIALMVSVGVMLCIIPGIVFAALWIFTWPLLMDKRLDFWPAMEVSRRVLWPNVWGVLGLLLVVIGVIIVGLLCCYVGAFVAMPVVVAAQAYAYEDFFGTKAASSAPVPAKSN